MKLLTKKGLWMDRFGRGSRSGDSRRASRRGFTLVEIIVAIAILSIIAVGLFNVFIQSELINSKSKRMMDASYTCQSIIEEVQNATKGKTFVEMRGVLTVAPFAYTEQVIIANEDYTYLKVVGNETYSIQLIKSASLNGLVRVVVSLYDSALGGDALARVETFITPK